MCDHDWKGWRRSVSGKLCYRRCKKCSFVQKRWLSDGRFMGRSGNITPLGGYASPDPGPDLHGDQSK